MEAIGLVGCGLMGYGIATNLIRNGYDVAVYDTDPDAVARVVQVGGTATETIQELIKYKDILILSLPSTSLVEQLLTNEADGVLEELKPGSVVLDMSTNDVTITKSLAEKAKEFGVAYFDCPVSGGPDGAYNGTLTIMVGGSEEKYTDILPVLKTMGTHIEYLGESGAGQIVKLCGNMVVGGIISLLGEALRTGEKAGISKEKLAELFQKGSAQTKVMDVFGPNIIQENFDDVKFSLANMVKDLHLYRKLAIDEGIPTKVSDAAYQLFTDVSNEGKGHRDSTVVVELLKN